MLSPNAIFQVLVTSGNLPLAVDGEDLSKLKLGQLGVYNADTNIAVNAANAAKARNLFLAVGTEVDGSTPTVLLDYKKSAGQTIQTKGIKLVTSRCYTPPREQIVDITDFFAFCETDYAIKFRFENQSAMTRYGFNTPAKTFTATTSCCAISCDTVCKNFAAEAAYLLVQEINKDTDQLLTAQLIDYTTTPGTPAIVELEDYADWVEANEDKGLGIRVTTHPTKLQQYASINLGYEFPRGTHIITSLVGGFHCNGKVTEFQTLIYEEGAGYDIVQLEYFAGGWDGKPGIYRQSALFGLERPGIVTYADPKGKYLMFNWNYHVETREDRTYEANTDTIVAVPCADAATRDAFAVLIDAILAKHVGFDAIGDDVAACPACTVVNQTMPDASTIAAFAKDGIA